jgi:putative flavoprotein involved in K+ transport
VIGAGPAGLAASAGLTAAAVDHVVLERHSVAAPWRSERWDSLRTLTPNWMNGLPHLPYRGPDPDGYMTAAEVADRLVDYAAATGAPVESGVAVSAIRPHGRGHLVETDRGHWLADAVVLATGPGLPKLPPVAAELPGRVEQLTARDYRNPDQLGQGPVLVVGASASGVQIADELLRTGRDVAVAVGAHVRLPRTYRGRDILWWMQAMGVSSRRWDDDPDDIGRARHVPSPQLVGSPERRDLDLRTLRDDGAALVGRLVGVAGRRLQFAGSLANLVASADLKQARFLDQVDEFVATTGTDAPPPDRPHATVPGTPPTTLEVDRFDTVVWATGHRPVFPQLDPVHLDRRGGVIHDGGVLRAPGLFVLGLPFLRRRSSTFLSGIGRDAVELVAEVRHHLDRVVAAA